MSVEPRRVELFWAVHGERTACVRDVLGENNGVDATCSFQYSPVGSKVLGPIVVDNM